MNKTMRWAIFMLVATFVNLTLMILLFIALWMIFSLVITRSGDGNPGLTTALFIVTLCGSVFGSFAIYGVILKKVDKKWKLEEKLGRSIWGKPNRN